MCAMGGRRTNIWQAASLGYRASDARERSSVRPARNLFRPAILERTGECSVLL